jgi:hypothetical protein
MQMSEIVMTIVTTITTAFGNAAAPAVEEMVAQGTWESRDLIRALAAVDGKPDRAFIERHFHSLPAFTPAGLRHVLPTYLIYSLHHPQSDATERVIFHLSPAERDSEYWRERLDVFSTEERLAICEYVRFMQSEPSVQHYRDDLARAHAVWGCP